jgi:putative hydrolase of the HAD superfamily
MVSCVVFDMDDTLYAEVDYCKSGFQAVAAKLAETRAEANAEAIYENLWQVFSSGNHTTTFNKALDNLNIDYDDQLIGKLIKTYREHRPQISLPDGSRAVLENFHSRYKMALLTDGFLPGQELKVDALGLKKYFEYIVYTEQLGREFWKPSPAGFEKVLEYFNFTGPDCVYIGDNPKKDFIAPNKLGFMTVQLVTASLVHKTCPENKEAKAEYVIDSISKLPNLLKEVGE